jgi:hypothetical protein
MSSRYTQSISLAVRLGVGLTDSDRGTRSAHPALKRQCRVVLERNTRAVSIAARAEDCQVTEVRVRRDAELNRVV